VQLTEFARAVEDEFVRTRRSKRNAPSERKDSGEGGIAVLTESAQIDIKIDTDFDSFSLDQEKRVLKGIQEFLMATGDIRVTKKWRGCVGMRLSALSHEQAERLIWAVKRGDLEHLMLVDAEVVLDEEFLDEEWLDEDLDSAELENPWERGQRRQPLPPILLEHIHSLQWEGGQRRQSFPPKHSWHFRMKGIFDPILAALLLVFLLPVIGLLVILVRMTSPGPGIFCQTRVGRFGRRFTMYKIRTMCVDVENKTWAVLAQQNDPRCTRIGRVLRKLHLDELPMLFNILKGDMSLVGPRPERPEFAYILAEKIPNYCERLAVLPGVTGLAQINLPCDTDLESVRRNLMLDLEYIAAADPWLDFRLLASTFMHMAGVPGLVAARTSRVYRHVTVTPEEDVRRTGCGTPARPGDLAGKFGARENEDADGFDHYPK
jgi:lipopolysaccharide/colanic/teichoic acid biosynthesis glycosyltransferase